MGFKIKKFVYYLIKLKGRIFIPFILLYILMMAYLALLIEPQTFKTYLTSVYWVLTTLATVGFGDYAPVTTSGKVFTIVLYMTGIWLISFSIGKLIDSMYVIEKLKVGGKMKYTGKNHIILIGWGNKAKSAIHEILTSYKMNDIVIIDSMKTSPIVEDRIFYIRGDATDEETLLRANVHKAKGVIIFAEESIADNTKHDPLLVDGKTLLIATAITAIEKKLNLSVHVTVEVINQKHIRLFEQVMVDEFVPTEEMISHAAVRSLFSPGVTQVYSELMSGRYEEGMYEIPKRAEWLTFGDAFTELINKGATLVANHHDFTINKKLDEPIPEDAKLFVICDEETIAQLK
ncbi:ion channel [Pullulanibacillus sp. KACC 23026]|uniref:potassium channel family protein n=1 Tax=Pullulanibacillus sp. KACC 23026 TaxID=3028315 RepID=UPI0023B19FF3|nr:potassium channel protein [Pullulanibacillus sp. KACC 23026]WEG14669.1 ion channel [Pullulanibacillus sp. KACC 23026]